MATLDWTQRVETLYRDDGDRLWRALRTWSGDPDVASEAMAEAFAQALRRGPVLRDPGAWVWTAAFRIAAGELKARRQRHATAGVDGEHHDRYGDADLVAALRRLPDAQRAAVILYYYADMSLPQIATRLGSNRLAVAANLSRGRRRLHALLGDDHV